MRVTKREKFFRAAIISDCYYYDEQSIAGINFDKLLLLMKYKLVEEEDKKLRDLYYSVSGQSLSIFDYYICGFTNNMKKEEKIFGDKFVNFLENTIQKKELDVKEFDYFFNIVNTNVIDKDIKNVFMQIFSLFSRDLNINLCEKYFPEKLKEPSSIELSNNSNYPMLILKTINEEVESANERHRISSRTDRDDVLKIIKNAQNKQMLLKSLSDFIIRAVPIDKSLFKIELNSSNKGKIGESLFSNNVGGDIVGHLGKKVDVKTVKDNFSIKTTYASSWNHHLAYFPKGVIYDKFKETKRFSSIKDEKFFDELLLSFFKGTSTEDSVDYLVLQKVKMNEFNTIVENGKTYKIPFSLIDESIKSKSYIFNASELILLHEGEQFMKLNIKERTNGGQVMLIVTENNLDFLVEKNLIIKEELSLSLKKKGVGLR